MLRRTLEIAAVHLPGAAVDWSLQPYLEGASAIRATPSLRWHDWERYSNRQGRRMTLGGFLGTMDCDQEALDALFPGVLVGKCSDQYGGIGFWRGSSRRGAAVAPGGLGMGDVPFPGLTPPG